MHHPSEFFREQLVRVERPAEVYVAEAVGLAEGRVFPGPQQSATTQARNYVEWACDAYMRGRCDVYLKVLHVVHIADVFAVAARVGSAVFGKSIWYQTHHHTKYIGVMQTCNV
jgi:hypothetical protein